MAGQKEPAPEAVGDPGGEGARDQEAEADVQPQGADVHPEGVADRGQPARREQACQKRSLADRHVHLRVAFHPASPIALGLAPRLGGKPRGKGPAKEEGEDDDHQQATGELRSQKGPAQDDEEDQAQLEDQVGGGELEDDRGREAGPLAEQGAGDGDRRVGAGRGGGSQKAGDSQAARGGVTQRRGHRPAGDQALDHGREQKAQDQRPEDLPEHVEGRGQRRYYRF